MSQVSLQNQDSKVLKTGDYVKFAPNTRTACVFALIGESNIIGTCHEQIYPGKWGVVNLLNTVPQSEVINPYITAKEAEELTKGGETDLHSHTSSGGLNQAQILTRQL